RRIERGSFGYRPGLEDAPQLEPEVVMQPARRMLLNHKPQGLGAGYFAGAARFSGFIEIALGSIFGEFPIGHHTSIARQERLDARVAPVPWLIRASAIS